MINYENLSRHTDETGQRKYVLPNGKHFPSVTTILSNTGDKTFLTEWISYVGEAKAEHIRDEAAKIGTLMHEHLEAFIENRDRPKGNNIVRILVKKMSDKIIDNGLVNVNKVYGIEKALYSKLGWAGTADLIGEYQGIPTIMDYKNTRKIKNFGDKKITPDDKLGEYFCQLTAYIIAHNEMFSNNQIKQGIIFMVDRELNYQQYVLENKDLEFWTNIWLGRVAEYYTNNPELIELLDV